MKTYPWHTLILAAAVVAGTGTRANANLFTDNFDMLVVAERAKDAPPEPSKATSYVAFDGGYIEAGDPIAGDTPPTADQVRQGLSAALAEQGLQAAQASPSLALVYHWGVLRVDHREINVPYQIRKNLIARIELVSTQQSGAEVENHILNRDKAGGQDLSVASPRFLVAPLDAVIQHAQLPRIFVVVSAYDFQALAQRHEAKLVWRTKLSAQESSGEMVQVIPPLIAKGAPYFGKDFSDVQYAKATLEGKPAKIVPAAYNIQPSPESYNLDKQLINGLLKHERAKISGIDENADNG